MARDVRQLRAEASEASAAGKHKRALAAYLELEQREPRDAQWSKRAAETYKRLGKDKDAISAFSRAADRYAQGGFLVQAIAVCKLILQIDPKNDDALRRISSMNEQIGAGPTRAVAMAESNPTLAQSDAVNALRAGGSGAHPALRDASPTRPPPITEPVSPPSLPRTRTPAVVTPPANVVAPARTASASTGPANVVATAAAAVDEALPFAMSRTRSSTPPPLASARTKSKPITLPPDQPLESISLKDQIADSFEREAASGVYVIPIDETPVEDLLEVEAEGSAPGGDYGYDHPDAGYGNVSMPAIVVDDGAYAAGEADAGYQYSDDAGLGGLSSPMIEIEPPDEPGAEVDADDIDELELDDIEEIPLAEPRLLPAAAANALARTPLFADLSQDALESLVQQLTLVTLAAGEELFREGDAGDALYVIVEGEVAVQAEGPPRVEMARLGAGAFMGEVALMTDQPRSATVTAVTDAELLCIDRKTLSGVLATHGEVLAALLRFVRDRLVDRWTRTSPLFRPFDDSVRAQIASRFKFLEIDAGATLLKANAKPDGLYIVLAGKFAVRRDGAHVAAVGPGELIGETALLSGAAFKSEVVAQGKALALCLPAGDFRELIMTHPHVLEYIGEAAEHSRKLEIL
jgi:CRP-like cAMP-binding protein